MPRVVVTERARTDLDRRIRTHSLPAATRARVSRSLAPLAEHPARRAPLPGRWAPSRFVLGRWRWMLLVYVVDPDRDLVIVLSILDGWSAASPTSDPEA